MLKDDPVPFPSCSFLLLHQPFFEGTGVCVRSGTGEQIWHKPNCNGWFSDVSVHCTAS